MKKNERLALLGIAAYYVLAGFDFILIDKITETISTILMITFRLVICAVVMVLFVLIRRVRFSFSRKELGQVFLCSGLGIVAYYILESIGISRTSGSLASLILATIPIFGIISGRIFFRETVTRKSVICIVISIVGVVMVVAGNRQGSIAATLSGIGIMVLAAIVWVLYIVAVKPIKEKKGLEEVTTALFLLGGIISLPIFLCSIPVLLLDLSVMELLLTVLSAILCVALGQLMYIFGVEKVSVAQSSLYANLLPITTVVCSFLFLGEGLSLMQIIGGLVILVSVTLTAKE